MISHIVWRKVLTEKDIISFVVVMVTCVTRISRTILNQRNHRESCKVIKRLILINYHIFQQNCLPLTFAFSEVKPLPNTQQQIVTLVLSVAIPMLVVFMGATFFYFRKKKLGYFNEVLINIFIPI